MAPVQIRALAEKHVHNIISKGLLEVIAIELTFWTVILRLKNVCTASLSMVRATTNSQK